ncbi:MAG: sulfite exporter TauE/SafE family protein [Sulfolobaceae archaeon]
MNPIELFILLLSISTITGLIGALTGIGGATFLIPIYTLYLRIPIAYASGASLISTIATSSAAASSYIRDRITNIKIGMGLEIATTTGSISGSLIASLVYSRGLEYIIYIIFGIVLLSQVYFQLSKSREELPKITNPDKTTYIFQLYGKYYDPVLKREVEYYGVRWWLAEIIMFFAGFISGLLGVGSGPLKVLGMDWAMNLPIKVSTTTSNFMIGVTAVTGSAVYWAFGYIQPFLASTTAIGALIGAFLGTRILMRISGKSVRYAFTGILVFLGVQMILKGLGYGL